MLKTGNKDCQRGFTLVEVMVAVSVLALGTVMISQSNLMSMDVYGRYASRLSLQGLADEKIWEAKESLLSSGSSEGDETSGQWQTNGKNYSWTLVGRGLRKDLYEIELRVSGGEGRAKTQLWRVTRVYLKKKSV